MTIIAFLGNLLIPLNLSVTLLVLALLLFILRWRKTAGILAAGALAWVLFWSLPTAFLQGTAAAAGIAAINSVGNLAGFVSPYMIGALKDMTGSTSAGMYALAGVLVLGCIAVLRTPPQLVNK